MIKSVILEEKLRAYLLENKEAKVIKAGTGAEATPPPISEPPSGGEEEDPENNNTTSKSISLFIHI